MIQTFILTKVVEALCVTILLSDSVICGLPKKFHHPIFMNLSVHRIKQPKLLLKEKEKRKKDETRSHDEETNFVC